MIKRKIKNKNFDFLGSLIHTKNILSKIVSPVDANPYFLNWAVFGDSMAGSKSMFVLPHISNVIGQSGAFGSGNFNGVTKSGLMSAFLDSNVFPFEMTLLNSNQSFSFGLNGVDAYADIIKVFYINNGSTFSVTIDGEISNIITDNSGTVGVFKAIKTLSVHHIEVKGLTGNVLLPIYGMYNSKKSGVIPIYTNQGGNDLSSWIGNDLALTNLMSIYRELDVNLFSFEMKENVNGFENRFTKLIDTVQKTIPILDILLFCTTPIINDFDNTQESINNVLRQQAIVRNLNLFDCFRKIVSYSNMVDNDWTGDGIHPSLNCQRFLSNEFMKDFNLFDIATDSSPVSVRKKVKSDSFTSGENVLDIYAEPLFKLDSIIKTKRAIVFKNFNNTKTFNLDLGDSSNGSDGTSSVFPFIFRLGDGNSSIQGDVNGVTIRNGSRSGKGNVYANQIYADEYGTGGVDVKTKKGDGAIILTVFNATGNFVFKTGGTIPVDIPSAKMAIVSTTQGFLLPSMTTSQMNAISNPAVGLQVFNTDLQRICVFVGSWVKVITETI